MRAKYSEILNEAAGKACGCNSERPVWNTAEKIAVKGTYTEADLEGMEHLNYAAGIAPFVRGP